jgi:hypothetical protein
MVEGIELLGMLVHADEIAGHPQTWVLYGRFNDNTWVGVVGWPDTAEVPSPHQLDDLADEGWLRVLKSEGNSRHVAVTGPGREAWAAHIADTAHNSSAVDLSWSAARATLLQVYGLYRDQGAPPMGARIVPLADGSERGGQAEAHIGELVRGGYLEVGRESAAGPTHVRPTKLTLQLFDGWPAGPAQAALEELVRDVDIAIERTPDEERRSKLVALRDGLVGAGRDIAIAYLEKKIGI